jgi:hypothetical protein
MLGFFRKDGGLVTVEWVGIAAVMVLGAIGITSYVMQGTDKAGSQVTAGLASVDASDPAGPGAFGNGVADPVN